MSVIALVAFATLVAIAASELALAVADFPPGKTDHQRLLVEYDSVRGWRNVAGGHGRFVTDEFSVDLSYNARSYRGPLRSYNRPPGTFRVLMLGDSFLEGYTVALKDRVAEVTERLLASNPGAKPAEIVALGTGGYSTDQELLWLESEGVRYDPDLVVVLFVTNDIWFNGQPAYPRGPKPLFHLAGDSLVLANVPVPRLPAVAPAATTGKGPLRRAKQLVRSHSRLVRLAERAVRRTVWLQGLGARVGLLEAPATTVLASGKQVTIPEEFSVFADTLSGKADTAMEISARLLSRIRRDCPTLALLVPPNESLYPPGPLRSAHYQRIPVVGDADRGRARFRDLCARAAIRCLDPTDRFIRAADSLARTGQLLVFPEDGHWNELGHREVAAVLADLVRAEMKATVVGRCRTAHADLP